MRLLHLPQDDFEFALAPDGPGDEVALLWFTDGTGVLDVPSLDEAHGSQDIDGIAEVDYIPANLPE